MWQEKVAKRDSKIELKLQEVEALLKKLNIKIIGSCLRVEDTDNNRTFRVKDTELTGSYCEAIPRGFEHDRLVLEE